MLTKLCRYVVIVMSIFAIGGCVSTSQNSKATGIVNGEFGPCPPSPNCVSTMESSPSHFIDPIPYDGSREDAMSVVLGILNGPNLGKITILDSTDEYVHAVFITAFMRFRDDVEFYLPDGEGVIHFRSASRIGYSDLGKNRERMAAFREAFQAATGK